MVCKLVASSLVISFFADVEISRGDAEGTAVVKVHKVNIKEIPQIFKS